MDKWEAKLDGFRSLCSSMRSMDKDIEQFTVKYNGVSFDCILDIGTTPFELMIGSSANNFACILQVRAGFICSMPYADFCRLRDILHLHANSEQPFTSKKFLKYIGDHAPLQASFEMVKPAVLLPFRESRMSDANRREGFVFLRWLRHEGFNNGHVTAQNLEKTRLLLGAGASEFCREHDISSQWTTDPAKAGPLTRPQD